MIQLPLVTVLMPVYNAERYIRESVGSVLKQSFTDFELLIINDGSTDRTADIILSFDDPRIVLINQENQGIAPTLNKGLSLARAPYVARMDADDICYPGRLQRQFYFLVQNPSYVIVGSDADYISEDGEFLCTYVSKGHTNEEIMDRIQTDCPFQHSSVMFRKEPVVQCGGYPVHAHNFEDYLLWIKLKSYGRFYNIPEALIRYRFNPASVTIDEKWRGKQFCTLKQSIIDKGFVTGEEGDILLSIINQQDTRKIKEGSYHALCGKKFLLNNFQPLKARRHIWHSIRINPLRMDNYALWLVSYLPERYIQWLHKKMPGNI